MVVSQSQQVQGERRERPVHLCLDRCGSAWALESLRSLTPKGPKKAGDGWRTPAESGERVLCWLGHQHP